MLPLVALATFLGSDPVTQFAAEAQGKVGAAAVILEGRPILSLHAGDHFPMQSVYKLPIGMAALAQIDQGRLSLRQTVHVDPSEYIAKDYFSPLRDHNPNGVDVPLSELLRLAVSESDGTASDVVLRLIGGPSAAMKFLEWVRVPDIEIQDTEMRISHDNDLQYRNWATPDAAINLLRALQQSRGLSASSQSLLFKFLNETPNAPHRIKQFLPPGTVVAHKSGTSGTRHGIGAATNDTGIITLPDGRHLAIAVFVSDSRADAGIRDRVIAKIARDAWDQAVK